MNLPNYFLADLPAEAEFTPALITEACHTLKRNRKRYLAQRTTRDVIGVLGRVAEEWLHPQSEFRAMALELGPKETGFSAATLQTGLESFFGLLTPGNLELLILQDLGHPERLDRFCSAESDGPHRAALAIGPELLVHVAAGNLPNPTLMSMVFGLLARSAQFVKCARGASLLPRLFAHSIYEAERKLGACLEIAEWKGGTESLEAALFAQADCVTATGDDGTLEAIRCRLPAKARFVGYGHRVSFGFVTREALSGGQPPKAVADAARDVSSWNQLGCLSPHVIYVEAGGTIGPEAFAELLAEALEEAERSHPRGKLEPAEAAAIATRRSFYEIREAHSPETRMWRSEDSTAWTVVFEADPLFQASCLNRFVYVKSVSNLNEALHAADAFYDKISTVGLAAAGAKAGELAHQLARWGATRICPLGRMQEPPLPWRHDGRPALGDIVTWHDWETAEGGRRGGGSMD